MRSPPQPTSRGFKDGETEGRGGGPPAQRFLPQNRPGEEPGSESRTQALPRVNCAGRNQYVRDPPCLNRARRIHSQVRWVTLGPEMSAESR